MKNKLIVLFIFLTALLTSCNVNPDNQDSTTPPEERNYISSDITYSEPTAQYGFRLDMDYTETEFAKYHFESCIDDKERESCIETTDLLLSGQSRDGVVPEIYIFSQARYDYKYIITQHCITKILSQLKVYSNTIIVEILNTSLFSDH